MVFLLVNDPSLGLVQEHGRIVKFDTQKGGFEVQLVSKESNNTKLVVLASCKLTPTNLPASEFPPESKNGKSDQLDCCESKQHHSEPEFFCAIENPPKIGNVDVDAEHEAITTALNALLQAAKKSDQGAPLAMLGTVLACLEEHFEHEEELMVEAGMDEAFSALKGHQADHQRIIKLVKEASSDENNLGFVSLAKANAIAVHFTEHATQFDTLLEGRLV